MPAKPVPVMPASSLATMAREVAAQIASARDRLAETRGRLDSVLGEREKVLSQPTHPEDVREILIRNIKARAAEARNEVDYLLGDLHKRAGAAETARPGEAALYGVPDRVDSAMLFAILPPEMVADALLKLSTVQPTDGGLPVAERHAKVAELDAQAELLRGEIAELSQALEAAGVSIVKAA